MTLSGEPADVLLNGHVVKLASAYYVYMSIFVLLSTLGREASYYSE